MILNIISFISDRNILKIIFFKDFITVTLLSIIGINSMETKYETFNCNNVI